MSTSRIARLFLLLLLASCGGGGTGGSGASGEQGSRVSTPQAGYEMDELEFVLSAQEAWNPAELVLLIHLQKGIPSSEVIRRLESTFNINCGEFCFVKKRN